VVVEEVAKLKLEESESASFSKSESGGPTSRGVESGSALAPGTCLSITTTAAATIILEEPSILLVSRARFRTTTHLPK
jgi:hypothetical protein